jgi:hypothetical protein
MRFEIITDQKLPEKYMKLMNLHRIKHFGRKNIKDFKKDYWPGAKFCFLIDNNKILAFCGLRKITICYKNKKYNILGICNVISVINGKGYGKILIQRVINYVTKQSKTALGFCDQKNTLFYKNAGLNIKTNFSLRFALKHPKTNKLKFDKPSDGIFINGKDNLIKKISSNKELAYYYLPDIKDPHW